MHLREEPLTLVDQIPRVAVVVTYGSRAGVVEKRDHPGRQLVALRTIGIEVHEADQPSVTKRLVELFAGYEGLPIDELILVLLPMTTASLDRLGDALR